MSPEASAAVRLRYRFVIDNEGRLRAVTAGRSAAGRLVMAVGTAPRMSKGTRATQALAKAGIAFTLHAYDYDPDADRIGIQAAEALGEAPRRVLKTLMALVDGKPVCVILPSDQEVAMKKLAAALGGKAAQMMAPAEAERMTGYHVGGISPFGQKRQVPVAIDQAALSEEYVFLNGGQRGLQIRLDPRVAAKALNAVAAPLVA